MYYAYNTQPLSGHHCHQCNYYSTVALINVDIMMRSYGCLACPSLVIAKQLKAPGKRCYNACGEWRTLSTILIHKENGMMMYWHTQVENYKHRPVCVIYPACDPQ